MPTISETLSQTAETFQINLNKPFPHRYCYARSADTRAANDAGQDYLTFRYDECAFVFALCDGVSQSFYGDLAARLLGDALVDWLWNTLPYDANVQTIRVMLTDCLAALTTPATDLAQAHQIPESVPAIVREVLEQKRDKGSESTFVCGRVDLPSPTLPQGRLVLAWMGDSRLRVWGPAGERTRELGDKFQTAQRWSSRQGLVGGELNLFVAPIEQNKKREITLLMAYSDGLAAMDQFTNSPKNFTVQDLVERASQVAASDDISFLEVWLGGIPPKVLAPPLPAPGRLDTKLADGKVRAAWSAVAGASGYEIEAKNGGAQIWRVNGTTFELPALQPAKYSVRVRGCEGLDPGVWSVATIVEILAPPPPIASLEMPGATPLPKQIVRKPARRAPLLLGSVLVCLIGACLASIVASPFLVTLAPFATRTLTPTLTPTPSHTPTSTSTPTPTSTPTHTFTPTSTSTPTPTLSPTPRPQGNCADPGARIVGLPNDRIVSKTFQLRGTANAPDFAYSVLSIEANGVVIKDYRLSSPVSNNVLIDNPTPLALGEYKVKLVVYLKDGSSLAPCEYTIQVVP